MAKINDVQQFIEKMLDIITLEYTDIEHEEAQEDGLSFYKFNINTPQPQLLIGRHGDTLFSIQQLVRMAAKKMDDMNDVSIILDIDNYRRNQEESAIELAKRSINQVLKTEKPVHLVSMPAYKRRSVHKFVTSGEFDQIDAHSEGTGEDRHIVLTLKE